jgi:hypothetical protein
MDEAPINNIADISETSEEEEEFKPKKKSIAKPKPAVKKSPAKPKVKAPPKKKDDGDAPAKPKFESVLRFFFRGQVKDARDFAEYRFRFVMSASQLQLLDEPLDRLIREVKRSHKVLQTVWLV